MKWWHSRPQKLTLNVSWSSSSQSVKLTQSGNWFTERNGCERVKVRGSWMVCAPAGAATTSSTVVATANAKA